MGKLISSVLVLVFFSGCSTTRIKHAQFDNVTINSACWKSQAGIGKSATIEAITAPKTEASLTGL